MYNCKQETSSGVPDVTVIKNVGRRVQKKESEGFQELRVSPRLKSIPKDKQPYYGSDSRQQSATSEDDICGKEALYSNGKMKSCQRSSPRLKNIPEEKKPYNGTNLRHMSVTPEGDLCGKKTTSTNGKRKFCTYVGNVGKERTDVDHLPNKVEKNIEDFLVPAKVDDIEVFDLDNGPHLKWTNIESFLANNKLRKDNVGLNEVKGTLDKHNPHLIQMSERKEMLFQSDKFGHLPSIAVGHQFLSRADMLAVGFLGHWSNGIDYIGKLSAKLKKGNGYVHPLAIAIVLSGKSGDDADSSGEVVFAGQSRNECYDNDHEEVQVMHGSYFALKNNMDQSIPVRVFCRQKGSERDTGTVYVYCGLYKVMHHWAKKTVSGLMFSKCRLKRFVGHPKVNIDQVHFERERVCKISQRLLGLVCKDISYGEEDICIPVTNVIDDPPVVPKVFKYTKCLHFARNVTIPPVASGCKCKGNCTDPRSCSCAKLNGSVFPYVKQNGGRLIEPKDVVYECGPGCGCGSNCINRTSQRGVKHYLEIYRTENKGWAVRSLDFIPSGAPVCEYTGILKRSDELDDDAENDYIFDIDCLLTMNEIGGRERRKGSLPGAHFEIDEQMAGGDSEFCIDAGSCGNVSRFINHSCEPNLFVQSVLSAHHDLRLARVLLFAARDIPPMQELTYDYGYELDSVTGPDGKVKKLECHCGAKGCRGRLY